jgi:hypothetical protein
MLSVPRAAESSAGAGSCRRVSSAATGASIAPDQPQFRPVLLAPDDRRLPPAGRILEAVRLEQRVLEFAALLRAHLARRGVADDLLDAAAQLGARRWRRVDRRDTGQGMSQDYAEGAKADVAAPNRLKGK